MAQVVLLHALPFDHRMWDGVQAFLTDTIAPAMYGRGDSIQSWAESVLDELPGDELLLVGSSVGGSCALEMTRAAPDRVCGVVLVGAKADVRWDSSTRDAAVAVLEQEGVEGAWRRYWAPLFSPACDQAIMNSAREIALEQGVDDLIAGVRAFHDRRDHREFLRGWTKPLVLINGQLDRAPTPAAAVASVGRTRHRQMIIPDSGHYVPLEQPHLLAYDLERMFARSGGSLVGLGGVPDGLGPGAVAEHEGALVGDEADVSVG